MHGIGVTGGARHAKSASGHSASPAKCGEAVLVIDDNGVAQNFIGAAIALRR